MKINKYLVAMLAGTFILFFQTASAADLVAPERGVNNNSVNLSASETHKNLYVAGGSVTVDSRTQGDLYGAGGIIKITGSVESSLQVAGGNVDVSGSVGNSARIAGGNVSVSSAIGSDLLIAGGNVTITDQARIGGDLLAAGGSVVVDAPVGANARLAGGKIVINSKISGDLYVAANKSLTFGPNSEVTGKISYRGNQDPIIETGAKLGTIERSYFPKMNWFSPKFWALGIVLSLLAWLLAALVLNYFMHAKVAEAAMLLHGSFARRLGIGFVAAIVIPVVVVLLFITIIGYYLAFLLMIWFVFACMVSSLFGAVYLGKLLYGYFDKNAAGITWPMIVVGVVVYKVLGWIPFLGWIVIAIFSLAAFGTILSLLWEQVKSFKLQRTNTK